MKQGSAGLNSSSPRVVILAAGSPHFGDLATPNQKAILGQTVLDLTVGGLRSLGLTEICVVTGDKASSFQVEKYQHIEFIHNGHWQELGRVSSILLGAQSANNELLVLYGDTLFREEAIRRMLGTAGDLTIGIDEIGQVSSESTSTPKIGGHETIRLNNGSPVFESSISPDRYSPELAGIFLFRETALDSLRSASSNLLGAPDLVEDSFLDTLSVVSRDIGETEFVSVSGLRTEIRTAVDIPTFVLGSKSRALQTLRPLLKKSTIQDQLVTTRDAWVNDSQRICNAIVEKFGEETSLIIRSSASGEDGFLSSQAGANLSRLNVVGCENICLAIEEVFASYANEISEDEVLIQPMVSSVLFSGVCLTRTLNEHAPWYVVSYTNDGLTDSVTSGRGDALVTRMISRDSTAHYSLPNTIKQLLSAISEIEDIVHFSALDIEFAIDEDLEIHIFQVRPLAGFHQHDSEESSDAEATRQLAKLEWNRRTDYELFGTKIQPFLSNMADWNPAEMIGENPGRLARTLYETLITDDTWAVQRFEAGYHDFRGFRLMTSIYGRPYIDARLSLGSFVPRAVEETTAAKVVEFSVSTLSKSPHLHDKIEFDIAPTCIDLNWSKWRDRYASSLGLTARELEEFEGGLFEVTRTTVSLAPVALEQINSLDNKLTSLRDGLESLSLAKTIDLLRNLGALPFAHLARAGFVSVSMLRSGVSMGVLSATALSDFFSSLQTISAQLLDEAYLVKTGKKQFDDYVKAFGHLRPGTYDLQSPRYDSLPSMFLGPIIDRASPRTSVAGRVWDSEKTVFLEELVRRGIFTNSTSAEAALRLGIIGREKGKFIYSKGLSYILDRIETLGAKFGAGPEALSAASISQILAVEERGASGPEALAIIEAPEAVSGHPHGFSSPVIMAPEDLHHYIELEDQPNFIGVSLGLGPVIFLSGNERDAELFGSSPAIVLVERADPGFDWIFGKNIAGLITQFGGANSHMAIRTAEFGIPAAIGVGRRKFDELRRANLVEINPGSKVVRKVT